MDSLTQIALGASVAEAVMQNKVGRKATLWGAVIGTLPDLDVFIPMGNAIRDFTYHRAESHAFFYMALATPLIVWLITKIHPGTKSHKIRWLFAVFLVFITHALLDSFNVYGTQLLLPFTNHPFGWGTVFVIDPLYTIPLLLGVTSFFFLRNKPRLALKFNLIGLIISSLYLLWSLGAQQYVYSVAKKSLATQNIEVSKTLAGPTPFNTFLWRIIGKTESGYIEGYYSIFDQSKEIRFKAHTSEHELLKPISDDWNVERLKWFTKGFYKVYAVGDKIVITDIRMGASGMYFFNFVVGQKTAEGIKSAPVEKIDPEEFNGAEPLKNLWKRIWNEDVEL